MHDTIPIEKSKPNDFHAFASVDSTNNSSSSIEILHASMTKEGITKVLLDEKMTLSTNTISGDTTDNASAFLAIPYDGSIKPKIHTIGNAEVTNDKSPFDIEIPLNKKKIKIQSKNGLFAIIRVLEQRDRSFKFLNILFGLTGQKEFKNKEGRKNRSELSFYSNGNGKFIRLSDINGDIDQTWEIENIMTYEPKDKNIFPSTLTISSKRFQEKLILNFDFNPDISKVVLIYGLFK